jgi:hypothetical protein
MGIYRYMTVFEEVKQLEEETRQRNSPQKASFDSRLAGHRKTTMSSSKSATKLFAAAPRASIMQPAID